MPILEPRRKKPVRENEKTGKDSEFMMLDDGKSSMQPSSSTSDAYLLPPVPKRVRRDETIDTSDNPEKDLAPLPVNTNQHVFHSHTDVLGLMHINDIPIFAVEKIFQHDKFELVLAFQAGATAEMKNLVFTLKSQIINSTSLENIEKLCVSHAKLQEMLWGERVLFDERAKKLSLEMDKLVTKLSVLSEEKNLTVQEANYLKSRNYELAAQL